LFQHDLDRIVPRRDGGDHPDGFLDHPSQIVTAEGGTRPELSFPGEGVDQFGRIGQRIGKGPVELGDVGGHQRCADLGDDFLAQVLAFVLQRFLQLQQATLAQRLVRRPGRLVEGPPGRGDGRIHVFGTRRRCRAKHGAGRRADVGEGLAGARLAQATVDEHPRLGPSRDPLVERSAGRIRRQGHPVTPSRPS
jgi:hypothetical protein